MGSWLQVQRGNNRLVNGKSKKKKIWFFLESLLEDCCVFLIALIIVSVVYLYIAAFTAEMYFQEASQRLNEEVAQHIADENQCFINGKANR